MYSSTLPLTSALDGGGWLTLRPGRLFPGKIPGTHFIRGWVGLGTGRENLAPTGGFFFPLIHFCTSKSFVLHATYVPYYRPYTTNTTQTSIPPVGFEPASPVSERPQTHALDRTATGIGIPGPSKPQRVAIPTELCRPSLLYSRTYYLEAFICVLE